MSPKTNCVLKLKYMGLPYFVDSMKCFRNQKKSVHDAIALMVSTATYLIAWRLLFMRLKMHQFNIVY